MPRVNLWVKEENYEMYQSIPNKSGWINDLLSLLKDETVKELVQPDKTPETVLDDHVIVNEEDI